MIKGRRQRSNISLQAPRPAKFSDNGDRFGWHQSDDRRWHYTLYIENGRLQDRPGFPLKQGICELARIHPGGFRLTPGQNLVIANMRHKDRLRVEEVLKRYGLEHQQAVSGLRRNSIACVALPTCGLAMAESERYLPALVSRIEKILDRHGLRGLPITIRMSGCPNGCSRPYLAEIGLTGRGGLESR
jgi:sulfite reductase (NADPH) hemoprotein beta-component